VYELAAWATGPWTAVVLAWAYAGIVGLSNALPMQVGVARVVFAMGRDRQLPGFLARVHPRYHTPYMGMLVTAALSLAVAVYMKNQLDDLASIVNFGALSGFLFLHVSVLGYFGVKRRSRAWIRHWLVPLCGIAVVLAVFSGMSALAVKVGVSWLAVGLIYGAVLKARHREELAVMCSGCSPNTAGPHHTAESHERRLERDLRRLARMRATRPRTAYRNSGTSPRGEVERPTAAASAWTGNRAPTAAFIVAARLPATGRPCDAAQTHRADVPVGTSCT
jgi:amino acid transporter